VTVSEETAAHPLSHIEEITIMHPMSHALAEMVARTAAKARQTKPNPIDPQELERAIERSLGELQRSRPRIVTFAPSVALMRVMAKFA
jgi:hypothetical protein